MTCSVHLADSLCVHAGRYLGEQTVYINRAISTANEWLLEILLVLRSARSLHGFLRVLLPVSQTLMSIPTLLSHISTGPANTSVMHFHPSLTIHQFKGSSGSHLYSHDRAGMGDAYTTCLHACPHTCVNHIHATASHFGLWWVPPLLNTETLLKTSAVQGHHGFINFLPRASSLQLLLEFIIFLGQWCLLL